MVRSLKIYIAFKTPTAQQQLSNNLFALCNRYTAIEHYTHDVGAPFCGHT